MKKILFVNFTKIYGGAEVYLEEIINYKKENYRKYILSPQNKMLNKLKEDVIILKGYYKQGGIKNIINYYYYLKEIYLINRIIKKEKIDIVFFNGIESAYMSYFINKNIKKIAIWHINSINKNKCIKYLFKLTLDSLNIFITINKKQEENIKKEFGEKYLKKLKLIYNGVDSKKFKYSLPKEKTKIKIAQISRLEKHKGILDLIKAFKMLNKDNVELLIAGEGIEKEKIDKYIINNKLENKIKLVGFVQTNEFLKEIDILVLASYSEAFPLTLLEGLSCGIPIIATNVDGIPEIIQNDYNGYLFEAGNIKNLSLLLNEMIENIEIRRLFSIRGRKKFIENFTSKKMCELTYKILEG